MLDNQLIALVISSIIAGEAVAGIPNTPVKKAFQPTTQGTNSQPTIYLHKLFDKRLGSPYRGNFWDINNNKMVHTELQQYETTFQLSALSMQNPATPMQMTASDLCNLVAYIMQSDKFLALLRASNVGILRISDVRNPYFLNDTQRNEANPSFDFVLTHKQIINDNIDIITTAEYQVLTV